MGLPVIFITLLASLLKRVSIKININYEKKVMKRILKIEHDRFEICQTHKEKVRVLWIVPKTRFIHRTANDDWDVKPLWW